ncbi:MAG: M48 family metalloprotease [Deltaproteobacteria bacterium]|nr:M48 family metalloprotease [Deltaproteobacteria bacterium]
MQKSRYMAALMAFFFAFGLIMPGYATAITIFEEKKLWDEFYQTLSQQYTIIDDPVINRYVNGLGKKILAAAPPQPFEFHFHVIREDAINAFAAPAGHIFVFSGLFAIMENEDELAGILSHEIAHATCRHISTMIEQSKKTNMLTLAGIAAGILVGLGGAASAGSALTFGSLATGQSISIAYTREHEMQADQIGRTYLEKAGYSVYGLINALKSIRSREWFGKESVPAYLMTHPATGDRIVYLDNLVKGKKAPTPVKSYVFDLARARLIGMYESIDTAAARLSDMLAKDPENPAVLYGYGLVLTRKGKFEKGASMIQKALKIKDDPVMRIELGRIAYLSGKTDQAVEILTAIPGLERLGPFGLVYLARALLDKKKVPAAVLICEKLLAAYPENAQGLYVCGRAFGSYGDMANAHFYLGKYYAKTGDIANAIFHFNQALAATTDDGRKKEIEKLLSDLSHRRRQPVRRTDEVGM